MSVANLLGDIFTGNFSHALKRLEDFWATLKPSAKAFITKIETDEGKILVDLAETAANDVKAGGLTTASFVAAAKDIEAKLIAQNIAMARTDIFAALNVAVGYLQSEPV